MMHITIRRHRVLLGDLMVILVSAWLSFFLNLSTGLHINNFILAALFFSGFSVLVKLSVFHLFGIYRINWKYIGPGEIFKLSVGSIFSSAVLVLVLISAIWIGLPLIIPRIVIGIDWILTTLMLFLYRKLAY